MGRLHASLTSRAQGYPLMGRIEKQCLMRPQNKKVWEPCSRRKERDTSVSSQRTPAKVVENYSSFRIVNTHHASGATCT